MIFCKSIGPFPSLGPIIPYYNKPKNNVSMKRGLCGIYGPIEFYLIPPLAIN